MPRAIPQVHSGQVRPKPTWTTGKPLIGGARRAFSSSRRESISAADRLGSQDAKVCSWGVTGVVIRFAARLASRRHGLGNCIRLRRQLPVN